MTIPFKVFPLQRNLAGAASETVRMELETIGRPVTPSFDCLQILSLDPSVACMAQRVVALVIVLGAIWKVIQDVKVGGLERSFAIIAYKAGPVIPARKPAIRGRHRFTDDHLATAAARALWAGGCTGRSISGRASCCRGLRLVLLCRFLHGLIMKKGHASHTDGGIGWGVWTEKMLRHPGRLESVRPCH